MLSVGYHGPVVLGVNWYEAMFEPDEEHTLHVEGDIAGGHALLCNAVSLKRQAVWLSNSWGLDWGFNGGAWLGFEDLQRLLEEEGEACVPVRVRHA